MEINKSELEKALERVKPGLANKEIVEQATSFAFIKDRVVTYNNEISISQKVTGLNITGAVLADNLYKLLGKIKIPKDDDGMIDISIKDNELILSKGKMKAGFAMQETIKLPIDEEITEIGAWCDLPDKFIEFVDLIAPSCGRDMSRPVLTCIYVSKDGIMEGSDSFCIMHCNLSEDMPVESFLLPAASAKEVIRISPIQIAEGKGWIHFKNAEDTMISCRVFEDKWMEKPELFKVTGHQIIFPEKLVELLDRANIVAKRDHEIEEMVKIEIADKKLKIIADSDISWIKEELPINYKEPVSFTITPYLLRQIIQKTKLCLVGKDKLKFEGEGWIYIAALRG
jgi:DNA polymerase III sliding clamp (beta) subunit (PCNA family)